MSVKRFPVLDHGYVELVESWGSDERIIEAARMSTGKGFQGWGPYTCDTCSGSGQVDENNTPVLSGFHLICKRCKGEGIVSGDEKLLSYLYKHKHFTPFEMCGATFEIQAPIFVFREWHRHRTQSYNELSSRYTPLPDINYTPTFERISLSDSKNRQSTGTRELTKYPSSTDDWLRELDDLYKRAQYVYEYGLNLGIPKELARLPVPVARYSKMRASANLRNWLHFLSLRMNKNAQWEIQQFANAVGSVISQLFPRTWGLFKNEQTSS